MAKNRRFPRLRRPWARRVIEHRWGNFWAGCGAAPWSGPQHVVQMLPAAKQVALAVFGTVGSAVATPACAQPLLSHRGASFAHRRRSSTLCCLRRRARVVRSARGSTGRARAGIEIPSYASPERSVDAAHRYRQALRICAADRRRRRGRRRDALRRKRHRSPCLRHWTYPARGFHPRAGSPAKPTGRRDRQAWRLGPMPTQAPARRRSDAA